ADLAVDDRNIEVDPHQNALAGNGADIVEGLEVGHVEVLSGKSERTLPCVLGDARPATAFGRKNRRQPVRRPAARRLPYPPRSRFPATEAARFRPPLPAFPLPLPARAADRRAS